ncbi:bifunctional UDP-N-acetylmuramoyl-tripeptide:D-alanyl-D-alanine ligase/alanine racemase [Bacteroidota bacterium]
MNYSISEISKIVSGDIITNYNHDELITDVLIDSRKIVSSNNCIFFALISKTNDGHKYIDSLYKQGIRNFIVSTIPSNLEELQESNFIVVKNTLPALQQLAKSHRNKFNIPVIGITGSNGKTIIKEWLYQLLSSEKKIVRSPKSYNSQIGVPLSVLQINQDHNLGIFEAGISEPDEMDKLAPIINPNIGIFTNIGPAHGENFINLKQKVSEKLKLFVKVKTLIYCSDYIEIRERIIKSEIFKNFEIFSWGKNSNADISIKEILKNSKETTITAEYKSEEVEITIPFIDEASIENAIHCWVCLIYLGYDQSFINNGMKALAPVAMRLELKEGINNCTIINDSYNSDINSLNIAIDFLTQQNQHRKKTIILSDILQSDKNDIDLYTEVASLIKDKGLSRIIGIGTSIAKYADKFAIEKEFYDNTAEFLKYFAISSLNNETILLKGARKFEFENINKILQQKAHETVLEINLNSIIHNLNYYRSILNPSTKIMAMVKAFSYGSGSYEIANVLQFHNIDYLAVAYADEGVELRKTGISLPIMVMNPDEQSFDAMITHNLEPEIYSFKVLGLLEKAIERNLIQTNKPIGIHLKFDTGMHRLGFEKKDLDKLIQKLKNNTQIILKSVFSHLAASEESIHDDFTKNQIELFTDISKKIKAEFNYDILIHILNSAGISRFKDSHFDMVRLGISLYGIATDISQQHALENVSTLKSTISQIKQIDYNDTIGYNRSWIAKRRTKIATIPIGYADGLNRMLGNGVGKVWINGRFAPIVGNICMDMSMLDITDISAEEGDDVIIFGKEYSISDLANDIDTIPYEILTNVSRRVKRVYFYE